MDRKMCKALKKLVEDIFACFIQSDYEENLYLYERRVHISKMKCLALIQRRAKDAGVSRVILFYNGLIDCGLLRWRIKDKSVFSICHAELVGIRDALIKMLGGEEDHLDECIMALESVNQTVLQVAAKEPLPLLLFICGLKTLKESYLAIDRIASA